MTVKQLRDFLNSIDLDSIQEGITVASVTEAGKRHIIIDDLVEAEIYNPAFEGPKPYLQFTTREAAELLEECDKQILESED